jgi:hydrogenase maturation factor
VPRHARGRLPSGKIPVRLLARLLKKYAPGGRGVIVGPSVGIDCAVIDIGGRFILAKTDPITFVAEDIGLYTLNINANDIAVMGGVPRWFLATVLLPEGKTTERFVEKIFKQLSLACRELGVTLCGGHTEVTPGLSRPIIIGQMLGEAGKKGIITAAGAKLGDDIILTKGIALEAASIIAREKGRELRKVFPERFIKRCRNFVKRPGISVLKDARIAIRAGRVHAMHDPTEGGLSMGLHELAIASSVGIVVYKDRIPIIPESKRLLGHYGLNPLGAIASGSLLISIDNRDTIRVVRALEKAAIPASHIGSVTPKKDGVKMVEGGKLKPLKAYERDEITKIL